jgi:hypothetical protein
MAEPHGRTRADVKPASSVVRDIDVSVLPEASGPLIVCP